jgi:hypothetical protein
MTNKTITIHPDLFKIPKHTKKGSSSTPKKEIKVKTNTPVNNKTKKNKLLGYIRKKQEELENRPIPSLQQITPANSEFEESVLFFKELENNEPVVVSTTPLLEPLLQPTVFIPPFQPQPQHLQPQPHIIHLEPPPKYGILKNGNLPTYKQYMSLQQQHTPFSNPPLPQCHQQPFIIQNRNNIDSVIENIIEDIKEDETDNDLLSKDLSKELLKHKYIQSSNKNKDSLAKNNTTKIHYPKRKKTIRRKFSIGHSKKNLNIGVLISNKTIRNQIISKKQLLKQTPITEVKQFLLNKGLIKIGSVAPNDVLRKMYESASLICGDVQNHNNDILLHNYFYKK